jgi:hypothetical protein
MTFHEYDAAREPVAGRKFHAVVQCTRCYAVWRVEVFAKPYITLVEEGSNPNAVIVEVDRSEPREIWDQLRRDTASPVALDQPVHIGCPACHTMWTARPRQYMTCVNEACRTRFRVIAGRVTDSRWTSFTYGDTQLGEEFAHPSRDLGTDATSAMLAGTRIGPIDWRGFPYAHFLLTLTNQLETVTVGFATPYNENPPPYQRSFQSAWSPAGGREGFYTVTLDLRNDDIVSLSLPVKRPSRIGDVALGKAMTDFLVKDANGAGWKIRVEREHTER